MIGKIKDALATAFVLGAVSHASDSSVKQPEKLDAPDGLVERPESAAGVVVSNVAETDGAGDDFGNKKEQKDKQEKLDAETVSNLTKELNDLMREINCDIEFKYSQEADMMSVKMVDKETKEVLREFPPEDMIESLIKAHDWLGAFLDKNA